MSKPDQTDKNWKDESLDTAKGFARSARDMGLDALFSMLRKLSVRSESRDLATEMLQGLLQKHPLIPLKGRDLPAPPYTDLGRAEPCTEEREGVVFITARFRSGSTLLWNLFRQMEGYTAYYEPFHEYRWFDPSSQSRGTDATHKNVSDYRREYKDLFELGRYYRKEWTYRNLFMDEDFHAPEMKRYIETMIRRAPGIPVLQFNRIDFRLPWIKRNFPDVKVLHLYRHPRDQWCSSLRNPERYARTESFEEFSGHDYFYLLPWLRDLKHPFPFLAEEYLGSVYQGFYYLWRLSSLYGTALADYSVCFEALVTEPREEITALFKALQIDMADPEPLLSVIEKPEIGKWSRYADEEWFRKQEEQCEKVLAEYIATQPREPSPVSNHPRSPRNKIRLR